jgi:hypothetical protein
MLKKVKLSCDFNKFLTADYSVHSDSCVKHQVNELKDLHASFGGFPKSYCLENTKIHQLWWTNEDIDYALLGEQLGMEVVTVSTILQEPGSVIPWHCDTFYQITKRFPDRKERKVRANIYLEDYKIGQFIQYQDGDELKTSTNWKQGEGHMWDSSILHLGSNSGMENKITMQVSGFLINE